MVTDAQVRRLKRLSKTGKNRELAAAKAGMDPKTARGYLGDPRLPSERKVDRTWRTRSDPFTGVWDEVRQQVSANPGLEAKTLFEALPPDRDAQLVHVREVGLTQPSRHVTLREKHFPFGPVRRAPLLQPTLQRSNLAVGKPARILPL